jgi:hypothetical protein
MSYLLKKTVRDFFSPVANFRYIVSAVRGKLPPEDHSQTPDQKTKPPALQR